MKKATRFTDMCWEHGCREEAEFAIQKRFYSMNDWKVCRKHAVILMLKDKAKGRALKRLEKA